MFSLKRYEYSNKQILNLALPSIISNITVPLLGLVDLAIVGHLNNIALIGAVAVATTIFNVQYWLLGFLRMGTSGLTAQALGKRNFHEVLKVLLRAFLLQPLSRCCSLQCNREFCGVL